MKKTTLTLLIAFLSGMLHAQTLQWAKQTGNTNINDLSFSVAVDGAGNVFTTGSFTDTVDFDPGPGTFNMVSAGTEDVFISKLNATGNFVWAKRIGGKNDDTGMSIAVDDAGNVFIAGYFSASADMDPGAAVLNFTSNGFSDVFVTKLDVSGNLIWAKQMGGSGGDQGTAIAIDGSQNVYTTGVFNSTADFDPGAATFNLLSQGQEDIFISKLDASGNFMWAEDIGGIGTNIANSIAVDALGNIYTTGYFYATTDFDPGAGTFNLTPPSSGSAAFVSKLNTSGGFAWAVSYGGPFSSYAQGNGITTDALGNVYTTGTFTKTIDFDGSASTFNFTSLGNSNDVFITKLNASGNFVWAKRMGGFGLDYAYSIALDTLGEIFTTGNFDGTADFDPGANTFNLVSSGFFDVFISGLDASGNFIMAASVGGTQNDYGRDIAVDASKNIYSTGTFAGTADFDPGVTSLNLTSAGGFDDFIIKLSQGGCIIPPSCIISGNNSFCSGSSTQLCAPSGLAGYLWNTGATTQCVTANTAGIYSVTVTDANGCTSNCNMTITINPLPNVSFSGLAASYNVNASAATLTGTPSGGTFNGPGISGNTFTPSSAGVGGPYTITYSYTNGNGCSNSSSQQTTVTNCPTPARPGTISTTNGTAKVCPGDTKTYSVAVVPGAIIYTWTTPAGGNIISGQGTRIVTITYTTGFTANDFLTVVAGNNCGTSASRTLLISRNIPATPGTITGQTYGVCNLNGVVYSINNVAGMTYNWSWNVATATIAGGQGTNSVTADFSSSFTTAGIIRVSATNGCGTSAQRILTVRAYPGTPASISGSTAVCANQQGVPYSTPAVGFATNYTWSVPTGARINDGSTTSTSTTLVTAATSVTVNFATTSGNVRVRANNHCGSGSYGVLAVSFVCRDGEQLFTDELNLNCYPMPASDQLNVTFNSATTQSNSIRIFDLVGKTLLNQTNNTEAGVNKFVIDISTIASGIYILEVVNGNQKRLQKIVIE